MSTALIKFNSLENCKSYVNWLMSATKDDYNKYTDIHKMTIDNSYEVLKEYCNRTLYPSDYIPLLAIALSEPLKLDIAVDLVLLPYLKTLNDIYYEKYGINKKDFEKILKLCFEEVTNKGKKLYLHLLYLKYLYKYLAEGGV